MSLDIRQNIKYKKRNLLVRKILNEKDINKCTHIIIFFFYYYFFHFSSSVLFDMEGKLGGRIEKFIVRFSSKSSSSSTL